MIFHNGSKNLELVLALRDIKEILATRVSYEWYAANDSVEQTKNISVRAA